ncbi:FAD-linked sulfhydryl oxidase alr protein [Ceratobasidium theobromae]|uniref:Sulfhydryl oxidase n=1 Tax=Ceratobasidium theobromae TaxID=1582974 RepID=A0A5N5QE94_9AGAM|nr:FAD-linked sulfhydryl oxidase alr protein [Ceratobasidium theobromae]
MADNTPTPTADPTSEKPPLGVVLGPDGKPCKVCSSFKAWSKSQRAASTPSSSPLVTKTREHCPADVEALGRATWTFLHTTAAYYPASPSAQHKSSMLALLQSLPTLYPCSHCASDFGRDMRRNPPERAVSSRESLVRWLCERHNEVNTKLGKERFSCTVERLDERWKDGPKDASCD